jgi:hypothetical protein
MTTIAIATPILIPGLAEGLRSAELRDESDGAVDDVAEDEMDEVSELSEFRWAAEVGAPRSIKLLSDELEVARAEERLEPAGIVVFQSVSSQTWQPGPESYCIWDRCIDCRVSDSGFDRSSTHHQDRLKHWH